MLQNSKNIFVIAVAVLLFSSFVAYVGHQRSEAKPFWLDEGFVMQVCQYNSLPQLIKKGGFAQGSPNPLYYPFERAALGLPHTDSFTALTRFRMVSIASVTLACAFLMISMFRIFGLVAGISTGIVFLTQGLLMDFAIAENRPYAFWAFVFSLGFFSFVSCALSPEKLWKQALVFVSSMLLVLTAAPGFIQIFFAAAGIYFAWLVLKDFSPIKRPSIIFVGGLLAAGTIIFLHYGLKGARHDTGRDSDLLATGDWGLLWNVLSHLITIKTPAGIIKTAVFLFGLAAPLVFATKRFKSHHDNRIFVVSVSIVFQLFAACAIGFVVAIHHYFFVPKMFIFFAILVPVGGGAGMHILYKLLSHHNSKIAAALFSLLLFSGSTLAVRNQLNLVSQNKALFNAGESWLHEPCPLLKGELVLLSNGNFVHDANFIPRVERLLERCKREQGGRTYLRIEGAWPGKIIASTGVGIPDAKPVAVCGKPVSF
ncbi:MAG: hypothetical protein A2583_10485 [Bdellovibrionales bacterium RIFOXYD1_FULL_53_11]|nr:MAG: hypothetical protein A2583_10485 [Bdellovibrionales bacterium RIFOXYD1_FULL_53_11]